MVPRMALTLTFFRAVVIAEHATDQSDPPSGATK